MADISTDAGSWSSTPGSNNPTDGTTIGAGLGANLRAIQAGIKALISPLTAVSGTNTVIASHASLAAYASGFFFLTPANDNTGPTFGNWNALGNREIWSGGATCTGGELQAAAPTMLYDDGTRMHIVGRTPRYSSTGQTISNAGLLTLAHGLGIEPTMVIAVAQCTTIDANYAVGDRIVMPPVAETQGANDRGFSLRKDATNIKIRFANVGNPLIASDATTGVSTGLTSANWQLYVYAWVM